MSNSRGRGLWPVIRVAALLAMLAALLAACVEPPSAGDPARDPGGDPAAKRARQAIVDCAELPRVEPPPLGEDIEADMARRNAPGELAPAARAYGAEHPGEFGSLWLEHREEGSRLVVAFTGHIAEHEAALRERLGQDAAFRVQQVEHPYAELEEVLTAVAEQRESLNDAMGGALLSGFGIEDDRNRVTLHVVALDDHARRVLAERLDAGKLCVRGSDGPPRGVAPGGGAEGVEPVPTSEIANGEDALGGGRLHADPRTRCVWTDTGGHPQSVVWPPGFGVRFTDAGAELVDHRGRVVAREGDWLQLGGGGRSSAEHPMERCQVSEWIFVAGSVRVTAPPPGQSGG